MLYKLFLISTFFIFSSQHILKSATPQDVDQHNSSDSLAALDTDVLLAAVTADKVPVVVHSSTSRPKTLNIFANGKRVKKASEDTQGLPEKPLLELQTQEESRVAEAGLATTEIVEKADVQHISQILSEAQLLDMLQVALAEKGLVLEPEVSDLLVHVQKNRAHPLTIAEIITIVNLLPTVQEGQTLFIDNAGNGAIVNNVQLEKFNHLYQMLKIIPDYKQPFFLGDLCSGSIQLFNIILTLNDFKGDEWKNIIPWAETLSFEELKHLIRMLSFFGYQDEDVNEILNQILNYISEIALQKYAALGAREQLTIDQNCFAQSFRDERYHVLQQSSFRHDININQIAFSDYGIVAIVYDNGLCQFIDVITGDQKLNSFMDVAKVTFYKSKIAVLFQSDNRLELYNVMLDNNSLVRTGNVFPNVRSCTFNNDEMIVVGRDNTCQFLDAIEGQYYARRPTLYNVEQVSYKKNTLAILYTNKQLQLCNATLTHLEPIRTPIPNVTSFDLSFNGEIIGIIINRPLEHHPLFVRYYSNQLRLLNVNTGEIIKEVSSVLSVQCMYDKIVAVVRDVHVPYGCLTICEFLNLKNNTTDLMYTPNADVKKVFSSANGNEMALVYRSFNQNMYYRIYIKKDLTSVLREIVMKKIDQGLEEERLEKARLEKERKTNKNVYLPCSLL